MQVNVGHTESFKQSFSQSDFDRFANLSRDNNPIHVDPDFSAQTRFGGTVAHGMMLYSTICRSFSTRVPGDGVLQIQQDLMFQNPTYTQTEITVRCRVAAVFEPHGEIEMKTDIVLPDGSKACDGRALLAMPGFDIGFPGTDSRFDVREPSESTRLKHLCLGHKASVQRSFSAKDLDTYAGLTGDTNSLFADKRYAQKKGFKDRLIPGPLLSSMYSELLGTRLPGRGTNWLKQKLHFPAAAYVDDVISAEVEIVRLRPEKNLVNLLGTCTDSQGNLVCQAQSLVLVKDLED